jgi:hypothetical protein
MEDQFIHFPVRAEMELHPEALKLVDDEGSVLVGMEFVGGPASNCQRELSIVVLRHNNHRRSGAEAAGIVLMESRIHGFNTNFRANINANLNSTIDFGLLIPSYTFEQPFLGARANVAMLAAVGNVRTTLQGMIAGSLEPGENAQKSGLSACGIGATS